MGSPSIFVIGVGCIVNNLFAGWLCTNLGWSQHVWVAGVVPSIVVYNMCDKGRLKSAARGLVRLSPDLGILLYVVSVGLIAMLTDYVKLMPGIISALAGCLYFLMMSFSVEKTMYMADSCGTIGKSVFRRVIMNFISEIAWMRMKGEWSFCSPYSRDLVNVSTDHYYTLKKPPILSIEATSSQEEEEFTCRFPIEKCEVFCKYQYVKGYSNGIERRKQPNKVEVCLSYKKDPVEEYTYLRVAPKRVARLRSLLEILRKEKNIVLSDFHRNVGSELKLAHARCYEFDEILNLVLAKGCTVEKVNLEAQYHCSISGSSFPGGTTNGLILGLGCCLICNFCKLSIGASAAVFSVAIFLFAQMEVDVLRQLKKLQRGIQTIVSSILSSELLQIFRVCLPAGDLLVLIDEEKS